jgi:hypothetical protein
MGFLREVTADPDLRDFCGDAAMQEAVAPERAGATAPSLDADPLEVASPRPPSCGKPISSRQAATVAVTLSDSRPMTFLAMRVPADLVRVALAIPAA